MYARTSTWTGTPEALESWVRHVTEKVGPMVAGLPDNGGAYFFIDREQGRAFTLESTGAATGVELLERGRFEVVGKV